MVRVLILIVLFWLLYVVVKRLLANARSSSKSNSGNSENIVRCQQCGLYIPQSESKIKNRLTYCNNPDCLPKETQDGNPE